VPSKRSGSLSSVASSLTAIRTLKPTTIIGAAAVAVTFTGEVLQKAPSM
jgi:hypothetical protein